MQQYLRIERYHAHVYNAVKTKRVLPKCTVYAGVIQMVGESLRVFFD